MSRWDALKPDSKQRQKHQGDHHQSIHSDGSSSGRSHEFSSSLEFIANSRKNQSKLCKRVSGKTHVENGRNDHYIGDLLEIIRQDQECKSDASKFRNIIRLANRLSQLTAIDKGTCARRETEGWESIPMIVNDILLPHLSLVSMEISSFKCSHHGAAIVSTLDAITSILSHKNHRLTLMVATVDYVADSGKERMIANPLRLRLFDVLQRLLEKLHQTSAETTVDVTVQLISTHTDEHEEILKKACWCMICALQVAKKVDGIRDHAGQKSCFDVNPQNVIQFLLSSLQKLELKSPTNHNNEIIMERIYLALQLLYTLLQRHPECASVIAADLLLNNSSSWNRTLGNQYMGKASNSQKPGLMTCCPKCGFRKGIGSSSFLRFLHYSIDTSDGDSGNMTKNAATSAITCTTEVIKNLPLLLWLRHGKGSSQKKNYSSSSFRSYFINALEDVIRISGCMLNMFFVQYSGTAAFNTGAFCTLLEIILTKVPYHEVKEIEKSACTLINSMALFILSERNQFVEHRKALVAVWIECLGGRVTPQGEKTLISAPLLTWFQEERARVGRCERNELEAISRSLRQIDWFMKQLLERISKVMEVNWVESYPNTSSLFIDYRVLNAMLKNYPLCVFATNELFSQFRNMVHYMSVRTNAAQLNHDAATLINSLMKGRSEFEMQILSISNSIRLSASSFHDKVLGFVLPLVLKLISRKASSKEVLSPACISASCEAIGFLTKRDWMHILLSRIRDNDEHEKALLPQHIIFPVLSYCTDMSFSAKVRTAACKAVGTICSNIFAIHIMHASHIDDNIKEVHHILQPLEKLVPIEIMFVTLQQSLMDDAPSVRSMSLFAVGNLAQALYNDLVTVLTYSVVGDLILVSQRCFLLMTDEDEKVAGNAIRSIGHVAALFIRLENMHGLQGYSASFDVLEFFKNVVYLLVSKLKLAISLALRTANGEATVTNSRYSWKQRLGVKKQGWGACNTLALLFSNGLAEPSGNKVCIQLSQVSLLCLLDCITNITKMNEKVAISAIAAVRAVKADTIQEILVCGCSNQVAENRNATILGETIAQCFLCIFDPNIDCISISSKLFVEIELFLIHVLPYASCLNATVVVLSQRLSNQNGLVQIYHWLIEKECPAEVFDSFAQELRLVEVDVQIEQMFSNYAKMLNLLRLKTIDQLDDEQDEL